MTLPDIPECSVHWYEKVPTELKVRDTVPLPVFGMSDGAPDCGLNATLCNALKVKPTLPPTAISTEAGEKESPDVSTLAPRGNDAADTVTLAHACFVTSAVDLAQICAPGAATAVAKPNAEIETLVASAATHVTLVAVPAGPPVTVALNCKA